MEVWRDIAGYEGCYEVSNMGNVRSWISANGRGKRATPIQLTLRKMKGGYLAASLRHKTYLVHTLVLEAFVSARPEGMQACHGDGNPANNREGNLRWDTAKNNHADKLTHGTDFRGEKNPSVCLTQSQVNEIKERLKAAKWGDVSRIAREYGVDQTTISDIKTGRTWREVA